MLVVPVLLLGLAACSDDGAPGDGGTTGADAPSGSPTERTTSPPNLPKEPTVRHSVGAVADVSWDQSTCGTAAGKQTVEGTLTNPTKDRLGYVVTMSWTNDTNDVLGRGIAVVRGARPDEETPWELTGKVVDGATRCVIKVVRGDIPK